MLEALQGWVVKICTAVFFITAVEMILPNNSLKKYAKFVLGLILITILINPIIMIFNKNFEITTYTNKAIRYFEDGDYSKDVEKYKDISINNTISTFKLNLETTCEKQLKLKYPNKDYEVTAKVTYDKTTSEIKIEKLEVGIKDNGVKKIRKIEVDTKGCVSKESEKIDSKDIKEIKECLINDFNISEDRIVIYRL